MDGAETSGADESGARRGGRQCRRRVRRAVGVVLAVVAGSAALSAGAADAAETPSPGCAQLNQPEFDGTYSLKTVTAVFKQDEFVQFTPSPGGVNWRVSFSGGGASGFVQFPASAGGTGTVEGTNTFTFQSDAPLTWTVECLPVPTIDDLVAALRSYRLPSTNAAAERILDAVRQQRRDPKASCVAIDRFLANRADDNRRSTVPDRVFADQRQLVSRLYNALRCFS